MEQKVSAVCESLTHELFESFWPCLIRSSSSLSLSLQCPTTTSPQKHMKNRSKSTEEMQQTKKVGSNLTFKPPSVSSSSFILSCSSDLMWLPCLTLQAFPSQKSLPGRPELDKVKVSFLGIFLNSMMLFHIYFYITSWRLLWISNGIKNGISVFQECPDGSDTPSASMEELK